MNDEPTRVLICGGRDYNNKDFMFRELDDLCVIHNWRYPPDKDGNWLPNVHVIAGKAKGADTLAVDWAVVNWCDFTEFPADWNQYGKSAGYIRNKQMLDEGRPDYVVAFPGGKGTANMVQIAKKAGVPVIEVQE